MTDKEPTPERKRSKKKLKLEKRPLERPSEFDDLPVSEEEAKDVKGGVGKRGFAPPYVPV
jgi:hypothetical protein